MAKSQIQSRTKHTLFIRRVYPSVAVSQKLDCAAGPTQGTQYPTRAAAHPAPSTDRTTKQAETHPTDIPPLRVGVRRSPPPSPFFLFRPLPSPATAAEE